MMARGDEDGDGDEYMDEGECDRQWMRANVTVDGQG